MRNIVIVALALSLMSFKGCWKYTVPPSAWSTSKWISDKLNDKNRIEVAFGEHNNGEITLLEEANSLDQCHFTFKWSGLDGINWDSGTPKEIEIDTTDNCTQKEMLLSFLSKNKSIPEALRVNSLEIDQIEIMNIRLKRENEIKPFQYVMSLIDILVSIGAILFLFYLLLYRSKNVRDAQIVKDQKGSATRLIIIGILLIGLGIIWIVIKLISYT